MEMIEVYREVLKRAEATREASKTAEDEEMQASYRCVSQELYHVAMLMEKTKEINP